MIPAAFCWILQISFTMEVILKRKPQYVTTNLVNSIYFLNSLYFI